MASAVARAYSGVWVAKPQKLKAILKLSKQYYTLVFAYLLYNYAAF